MTTVSIMQPRKRKEDDPRLASRLLRSPGFVISAGFILLVTVLCIMANLVATADPLEVDLGSALQAPSPEHLLGTDQLGRDIFSRLLYGGRLSLLYALVVTLVGLAVGIALGLIAGYLGRLGRLGRTIDQAILFIADIGLAIPVMVVVIAILSVFRDYYPIAMVMFGVLLAPPVIRNVRAPVLAVRNELYVDAARVAGLSSGAILVRHILPRVLGPILVQATLIASMSLLFTVGLSYLGFGPQPPTPTWGSMVADASQVLPLSAWPLVVSGGLVGLLILTLSVLGNSIRDITVGEWTGRVRHRPDAVPTNADARDAAEWPMLSVRGLAVAFDRGHESVPVANHIDFSIERGEIVGLVGESGSGKTAIARALLRILPGTGRIVDGDIRFDGRSILRLSEAELRAYRGAGVSYVAQEPMASLDPTLRVGAILAEAIRAHHRAPKQQIRRQVLELLAKVQLPDPERVARAYPHELSGGMAQRVSIARAIASGPRLIVADEPTTALDATVQAEIIALLRQLRDELGISILLVSHDLGVVSELCDRAIVMYAGELVEFGPVHELLASPAHPYTRALAAARPSAATPRESPLLTIPGSVPQPGTWPAGCRFAARCAFATDACVRQPIVLEPIHDSSRSVRCIRSDELAGLEDWTIANV